MLSVEPFRPYPNGTISITATSANGTGALNTTAFPGFASLRIHNNSTATTAFVEFSGTSTVVAVTTSSMPIPPGAIEVVTIGQAAYVAAITASGTATVYFSQGYGI